MAMAPELRRAARLVVVDPTTHIFLLRYEDAGRSWWATPGGGLEGDETFEEAAAREATEELGVARPALTPLWSQTVEFTFRDQVIHQHERFFLMRLPQPNMPLGQVVREAHRLEGITDARWWSIEELETTTERVFPEDLGRRLRALPASSV